jgi:hypothetical protein
MRMRPLPFGFVRDAKELDERLFQSSSAAAHIVVLQRH